MENKQYKFNVALKRLPQKGTLAWEYNPFRNYRLDKDMIYYKNQFYTISDFKSNYIKDPSVKYNKENKVFEKKENGKTIIFNNWSELGFPKTEEIPLFYQKGQLVDFITDELDFDLNHPVQITPQYSYDNSVDLIINDGKSLPKIINSRFSAIGKNKYQIVDRNGNNDTNIYDKGTQFKVDTSLYKVTTKIPKLAFGGEAFGGNLSVGNYHFYFKYCDLDGNESEFIAQSGLVSVFIGNTPNSINSGFRDQNSYKKVRFILSNLDKAYDYILVYYSKATGEEFQNRTTKNAKILQKYKISSGNTTVIDITGFEEVEEITFHEINELLQIYDSAKTQAISQNMLFLGNVTKSQENHDYLSKLALYIVPTYDDSKECDINTLSKNYTGDITNTYYNPDFIYKYTGYWDDEIYRFGVVFIKENNTLTPVYNVRGLFLTATNETKLKEFELKQDDKTGKIENLVSYDETTYKIAESDLISNEHSYLENAKGVCYIPHNKYLNKVIGITFSCPDKIIKQLKNIGIKGYFIVRQKRIPTTLCQAYTIGLERESHTPMLPTGDKDYTYESFLNQTEQNYIYWDNGKKKQKKGYLLSNLFKNHESKAPKGVVSSSAAICPDYDVNSPYLNTFFTGTQFTVSTQYLSIYLKNNGDRLFEQENNPLECKVNPKYSTVKIIGVEDNTKLVGIEDTLFSARAGEAEEAFRFASVGTKNTKDNGGNNLLRGSYGPYLGITGYQSSGDLITIKIPGYNLSNMEDYFKIRYNDAAEFYPISDRLTFNSFDNNDYWRSLGTFYRGDCYICKFTHRLNRNFRDATTPTNDDIVDPSCWAKNIEYEDDVLKTENLDKINLGDVNAVNLGMWVSIIVRSNINHSVRSLDESQVDEAGLIGNCRGFFPYHPISARAGYKLPESNTYNKGFEASVGEQVFEELPIVPYYKDIYSTRIAYSNIQITNAFKNAYRVFQSTHYRDYPITYGEITKIIEWNGNLICVLEHGIYEIPINERAIAGEGSGGNVYINTSNVLPENPRVISDTFGSQWIDSIIKTPVGIYGVDTIAKKIWKVDNSGIELISDSKVQEFLNNNITLTERELTPIIGLRNVKTHYNAFKHDVMFTFYDDLNGISECVWNLCWNETQNKWVTFYSWVPSFSENIHNTYFSFDRETSKQIAKLALNEKSEHSDYIYLDNTKMSNEMRNNEKPVNYIGKLHYDLTYEGATTVNFKWEIVRDVYGNYKHFELRNEDELYYNDEYGNYVIDMPNEITYEEKDYKIIDNKWQCDSTEVTDEVLIQSLNKERLKVWKKEFDINKEKNDSFKPSLVNDPFKKQKTYILNIRVTPTITYDGEKANYAEYVTNKNANIQLNGGYIERTICVIPEEHLEALSTDFWRHGQSGIFDITEDIVPTKWYGKQHPFEFEFIVRDQADTHKIFDNLIIISNKAEPESFHYEIIGECYEFAKDKKNMYIRQEATKELFQNCGNDIEFNSNYKDLESKHREIPSSNFYEKSTILPAYYLRQDSINTIEDYYHSRPNEQGKDFRDWTGAEIVYYKNLNEFRIWNHAKANNLEYDGTIRGNMRYKEDKWYVQIPSINLVQYNEPSWNKVDFNEDNANENNIPVELKQANFFKQDEIELPKKDENGKEISPLDKRGIVLWPDNKIRWSEVKPKDKYIKIRVRYSGKDLAIISAIKTLYSISYA